MTSLLEGSMKQENISSGTLKTFDITMDTFPDKRLRTIRVWLPDIYDGVRRFPVMYMHDAQNLFTGFDTREKWGVETEIPKLGEECQTIVVGIDTAMTRFEELCPPLPIDTGFWAANLPYVPAPAMGQADLYSDFTVSILKPFIDCAFLTRPDKASTGIGGASMGGLVSLYMMLRHPEVFGRALVFSPAFAVINHSEIARRLESYNADILNDSRIFMMNGGQTLDKALLPEALAVYEMLAAKGLSYQHAAFLLDTREPHYETAWRKYFGQAVEYLYQPDNSVPFPQIIL
ncbi:hypothetical protein FACS18948_5650 [Clostridia bacterium]|nr:hypothetical protein FACS18948_5650 [Clostridia bacterium]